MRLSIPLSNFPIASFSIRDGGNLVIEFAYDLSIDELARNDHGGRTINPRAVKFRHRATSSATLESLRRSLSSKRATSTSTTVQSTVARFSTRDARHLVSINWTESRDATRSRDSRDRLFSRVAASRSAARVAPFRERGKRVVECVIKR